AQRASARGRGAGRPAPPAAAEGFAAGRRHPLHPAGTTVQPEAAEARGPSSRQTPWPRAERPRRRGLSTVDTDLGRYQLDRALGSGGMAIVYLAHDRELDRVVAVKRLDDNLYHDRSFRDRFLREAQLAAPLTHPNVVRVYDFGHDPDGRPFIVMEYVEGGSLAEALARDGALSPARAGGAARA